MAITLVPPLDRAPRSFVRELILRLTVPLGIVSLSAVFLLGIVAERYERNGIGEALTRTALRMEGALEANLTERAEDVAFLAEMQLLQTPVDPAAVRKVFDTLAGRQEAVAWIGRFDNEGMILAASGGLLQGQSGAQRPVFIEGRKGMFMGDVHEALLLAKLLPPTETGEPLRFIDIAYPVYRPDGALDGVLATHLSWTWVRRLFGQMLLESDRARGIELLVLNREDKVLAGPADSEGGTLRLAGLQPRPNRAAARWGQETWPHGPDYMYAYADADPQSLIGRLGWRVMVRQHASQALASVRQMRIQLASLAVLLTLGIGALAWFQARRITRPLAQITHAAESISRGEVVDIPHGSPLREVETLASSLQHMVHTLTHREQALDQMNTLAHRDTLTGLHNRRALELHMDLATERAVRSGDGFAILALDLDGFKLVNDTHGHAAGDVLLCEVARRLEDVVRSSEMLARLGGDEFVIMLSDPPERLKADAAAVATRVLSCFEEGFNLGAQTVYVGCSIGIALGTRPVETPRILLPRADRALYAAKRSGRGQVAWHEAEATA